ncbi:hypothetical protein [Aliterella atlantica]|uniref:Uncharacterized protein n=1 Tax=Aliterella atlantica CENA595 TaxID=1618023 RepID=A0A0D8ZYT0_9CYAN|nr:hypothetical protein [Aliterella atlantica]KJH72361.1 hypothetical protein UH38_08105 [Aliterella atlantica CENA595]
MHIIRLPNGEYINLAFVRRVQVEVREERSVAVIGWHGGGSQVYHGENAQAVIYQLSKLVSLSFGEQAEAIAQEIFNTFYPDSTPPRDLPPKDGMAISNARSGLINLLIEHKPELFEKFDLKPYISFKGRNLEFDEEQISESGEKGWITLDGDTEQTYRFRWSDVEKFGLSKHFYLMT